jgi:hypothetical protein
MRVTMHAVANDSGYLDKEYRTAHISRISVATRPLSQKVTVHLVQGYDETDRADTKVVLPSFADFLMVFKDYTDIRLARIGDL